MKTRRRTQVSVVTLAILGSIGLSQDLARAEPKVADPIPSPGRTLAGNDDASAIVTNPGNLAFLPEPELRWSWIYTQDSSPVPSRGHSIEFGYPLWILASGLRLDLIDPPDAAPTPFNDNYQWIRWSIAGRANRWLGFGNTFGWSIGDRDPLAGQFSVTTGLTVRPTSWLASSVVARDWNVPQSDDEKTRSARSWDVGISLRPVIGLRDFELGLEANYSEGDREWTPRVALGVDIPYVGRVRSDMEMVRLTSDDPEFLVTAGLDVNIGPMQGSGGVVFGDALGDAGTGFYLGAAMRGFREPGIPLPPRVVRIDIDNTPGARGHVRLLRRLWRLARDPEVEGVLLVMTDEPAATMAHAEEVGDALRTLRAYGKKTMCHLEDAGGKSLFVCSQADRIAMNPAGGLRFSGVSSRYFYFGGLLDKLGVKADFVRIGAHKSAAEQFTLEGGTDIGRADHQETVDLAYDVLLHDVGGGLGISKSKLKATIARGPFIAKEARKEGLVHSLAYPDELGRWVDEVMGRNVTLSREVPFPKSPKRWQDGDKIAVVYLDGDMVDGESMTIPVIGIRLAGSKTIAKALKAARDDSSVKGVIFRIETGGGSSLAADVILREAILTARAKPFVVSMGSAAASGGYYAAVAGKPIFANRTTVTGSIGIFYGKVDFSGLAKKLGVGIELFRSTPRADAESLFRPFTDEERAELGNKVKQFYDLFVGRVAEGRGMTPDAVDAVARGKVWTGAQASQKGLVDRIGGMREAVAEVAKQADIAIDTQIIELPEEDDSLLGFLLKLVGLADAGMPTLGIETLLLGTEGINILRAFAPLAVYRDGEPLARADLFEQIDVARTSDVEEEEP
jgi:protease IV